MFSEWLSIFPQLCRRHRTLHFSRASWTKPKAHLHSAFLLERELDESNLSMAPRNKKSYFPLLGIKARELHYPRIFASGSTKKPLLKPTSFEFDLNFKLNICWVAKIASFHLIKFRWSPTSQTMWEKLPGLCALKPSSCHKAYSFFHLKQTINGI